MEFIQKFFGFIIDFLCFSITGHTINFSVMLDGLEPFYNSFDEVANIFAWADAILPIEVIRVLLALILTTYILCGSTGFAKWIIDVIVP